MNVAAQTTTSVHHFLSITVSLLVASLASDGRFVDWIPRRPFAAWSMIAGRRAAQ
jgi:hypothetical protein